MKFKATIWTGGPDTGDVWTCGNCNALVTSDQSNVIVASFHEGSMTREEAATDLRLAGVHPGDVDARLDPAATVAQFRAATSSLPSTISAERQALLTLARDIRLLGASIEPKVMEPAMTKAVVTNMLALLDRLVVLMQRSAIDREAGK